MLFEKVGYSCCAAACGGSTSIRRPAHQPSYPPIRPGRPPCVHTGLDALLAGKPRLRRLDFSRGMAGPDLDLDTLHSQFHGVSLVYSYS